MEPADDPALLLSSEKTSTASASGTMASTRGSAAVGGGVDSSGLDIAALGVKPTAEAEASEMAAAKRLDHTQPALALETACQSN